MRKRDHEIRLLLDEKELRLLKKGMASTGLSRPDCLMKLVRDLPLHECPKPDLTAIRPVINEDGKEINGITRRFHASGKLDREKYAACLDRLDGHMSELEKIIREEVRKISEKEKGQKTDSGPLL